MLKLLLISLMMLTHPALAQEAACLNEANKKKLQDGDRASFLKLCEKNAITGCETIADEKNLGGTEKATFVAKCVKGTTGK